MITYQTKESMSFDIVRVHFIYEPDCSLEDKEYNLEVVGIIGSLWLGEDNDVDDFYLIREAIDEYVINNIQNPGVYEIELHADGEWEYVNWIRYFKITRVVILQRLD